MEEEIVFSEKMEEFIDKVDALCFEYGYQIHPTVQGWTGIPDENGRLKTIAIIGDGEVGEVTRIDGGHTLTLHGNMSTYRLTFVN